MISVYSISRSSETSLLCFASFKRSRRKFCVGKRRKEEKEYSDNLLNNKSFHLSVKQAYAFPPHNLPSTHLPRCNRCYLSRIHAKFS